MVLFKPISDDSEGYKGCISNGYVSLPLFPNINQPPLLEELIYIIELPAYGTQKQKGKIKYYFPPINAWNDVHSNPVVKVGSYTSNPYSSKSNKQIEAGSPKQQNPSSNPSIILGDTFSPRLIQNPQLFEGDVALKGRWGNSIHFTSTVKNKFNNWSDAGVNGDALTIIRNGQKNTEKDYFGPISEDINDDASSIYLTDGQQIKLNASSTSYNSYDDDAKPDAPNTFTGQQVLLNSGRLCLNSKTDSILLSSNKTINLNSVESVNIDAGSKLSISTPKIMLGTKANFNTEPSVLGDELVKKLNVILDKNIAIGNALGKLIGNLGVPVVPVMQAGIDASLALSQIKLELNSILQQNVRIVKNGELDNTPTSVKEVDSSISNKPMANADVVGSGFETPNQGGEYDVDNDGGDVPPVVPGASTNAKTSANGVNANKLRAVLKELGYKEKGIEIDNGADITADMEKAASAVFRKIKELYPKYRITVTGGNDAFHQKLPYTSRHTAGRGLDFVVRPYKESDLNNIVKILNGFSGANSKFRYIDEYRRVTSHGTGNHFHISWGSGSEGKSTQRTAQKDVEDGDIQGYKIV